MPGISERTELLHGAGAGQGPLNATQPGISFRRIVVPAEHGTWGFLSEPILLGLLAAFSPAGLLLALATIAAFLARQPLKLFAGDRRRGKRYPRTVAAERAFAVLAIVSAASLAGALLLARGPVLLAVGLALPLGALAVALDLSQRARVLVAELAAPLALGAAATAIALAAGWPRPPAFGLWGLLAARIIPTIFFVRARLRLERGEHAGRAVALLIQAAGLAWAAWLAWRGLAPWIAVAAVFVLALRAAHGLSPWRPRLTTKQLGFAELGYGLALVLAVAAAVWAGAWPAR